MIKAQQAWELIQQHSAKLPSIELSLGESLGHVLAQDIIAPIGLPVFNNSAVDGYALRIEDKGPFRVAGIIAAGLPAPSMTPPNTVWRIMTGAVVPEDCNAVIMQEDVVIMGDVVQFTRKPARYQHIRFAGEDIAQNFVALQQGTLLGAAQIGLLASLGLTKAAVYPRPRVALITTGTELVAPGVELKSGQIYASNDAMLSVLLKQLGADVVSCKQVSDDLEQTKQALLHAQDNSDVILIVGGISVGDYDYVRTAFTQLGVDEIFYKGQWRPGKPLFFGQWNTKAIFGLPGNPVSCFTMAHLFVRPLMQIMQGRSSKLPWKKAVLSHNFIKKTDWAVFARGNVDETGSLVLQTGQGSHELATLARSNALCYLREEQVELMSGDSIEYLLI